MTEKLPEVPTEEPLPEVPSEEPGMYELFCTITYCQDLFTLFFVVPKSFYTHPIVDFLDLNCSFVSYYPFKDLFQVSWSISIVMMNLIHVTHGWCF